MKNFNKPNLWTEVTEIIRVNHTLFMFFKYPQKTFILTELYQGA